MGPELTQTDWRKDIYHCRTCYRVRDQYGCDLRRGVLGLRDDMKNGWVNHPFCVYYAVRQRIFISAVVKILKLFFLMYTSYSLSESFSQGRQRHKHSTSLTL